jgi:hypothetical protein
LNALEDVRGGILNRLWGRFGSAGLERVVSIATGVLGEVQNRLAVQQSVLVVCGMHRRNQTHLDTLDLISNHAPSVVLDRLLLLFDVLVDFDEGLAQNVVL